MKQSEARKIWERENQKDIEEHRGTKCRWEGCGKGHYQVVDEPYPSDAFEGNEVYLECAKCKASISRATFRNWLSSKRRSAKREVEQTEAKIKDLRKELDKIKNAIRVEKLALGIRKARRKKWGY